MTAALLWIRLNPRAAAALAVLVALLAAAVGLYLKGRHDAAADERARDAIAIAAALKDDAKAHAKAADLRLHDAQLVAQTQKELTDAVAEVPDTVPDPVAVRLGCERLRKAGHDVSDLPACR